MEKTEPEISERLEALSEVTLVIAQTATRCHPTFAHRLGTNLRRLLGASTARPVVFDETLAWLDRYERSGR